MRQNAHCQPKSVSASVLLRLKIYLRLSALADNGADDADVGRRAAKPSDRTLSMRTAIKQSTRHVPGCVTGRLDTNTVVMLVKRDTAVCLRPL